MTPMRFFDARGQPKAYTKKKTTTHGGHLYKNSELSRCHRRFTLFLLFFYVRVSAITANSKQLHALGKSVKSGQEEREQTEDDEKRINTKTHKHTHFEQWEMHTHKINPNAKRNKFTSSYIYVSITICLSPYKVYGFKVGNKYILVNYFKLYSVSFG